MTNNAVKQKTPRDIRCGMCRQKGIFLCEHDTPYRDQYFGTFDRTKPRNIIVEEKPRYKNNPQNNDDHHQSKSSNKPLNNGNVNQPSKK